MKGINQEYWIEESIKDKLFEDTYTITKELGRFATQYFICLVTDIYIGFNMDAAFNFNYFSLAHASSADNI